MQAAKKLILVDEFDREYKRLKRPADAAVKTTHSLQLSDTLRNESRGDDQKVYEYVAALHRYLNLRKELPKPEEPKAKKEIKINPIHHIPPPPPLPLQPPPSPIQPPRTRAETRARAVRQLDTQAAAFASPLTSLRYHPYPPRSQRKGRGYPVRVKTPPPWVRY